MVRLRLKVETNTREHFSARHTVSRPFVVRSRWWSGRADVTTFPLEELIEENLARKIDQPALREDIHRLLPPGVPFELPAAIERVRRQLIDLLPGEPWKGTRRGRASSR